MRAAKNTFCRHRIVTLSLTSGFVLSAAVYAGPRPERNVTPQSLEKVKLIGVSRIDEMPPLPPNAKANTIVQPLGISVPIFRVLSDEEMSRGAVANTGSATAIVYRNSHDTGYALYNKADVGNFTGNLLHLGNGFPIDGGEISGYDLLIYNDRSDPDSGNAACTVSLWDGDPLGIIDTRISDPPQPIPGTTCTFTDLAESSIPPQFGCVVDTDGDGIPDECFESFEPIPCETDWDCGVCGGPVDGDDIPECPGLYRLVCEFDPKVTIPSRNVWMIVEWTEGCRWGWRWAYLERPEIAAVGEENFCAGTCPATPVPCVDLAIELVDGASQWSGVGTGTCCEDGAQCDHTIAVTCGHASSCSDGVATDFDAWCFGAPQYFASFVASIYANTDTTISLVPVGATGPHAIVGDEIIMPTGAQAINLEVFIAGWDPDQDGTPVIKVWQVTIDSNTYTSGLAGELTNSRPPCNYDSDCPNYVTDELCHGTYCGGAWIDWTRSELSLNYPACDVEHADPRCGSSAFYPGPPDVGTSEYAMSVRLESSLDAKGTFKVRLRPDPWTFMKDQHSVGIPLVGLIPAKITIEVGKCCDRSGGPGNELCLDNLTVGECDAVGGLFFPGELCDPDVDDSTECGPFCGDDEVNQSSEECDGVDAAACDGPCGLDCLCVRICGDDEVNQSWEECDGADDALCPGKCLPDCRCIAYCGDGLVNHVSEECDGTNANRCPGQCREDCTCPPGAIPTVSEWGLVALMLLMLSGAKIYYGRRRAFV